MISNTPPHTFIVHGIRFYFFMEHYDAEVDGKRLKGFHTYIFDQEGGCWDSCYNSTHSYTRTKGNGIFYQRTIWEADGLPFREPLEHDRWLDNNDDSAYTFESLRQFTGLDMVLLKQAQDA